MTVRKPLVNINGTVSELPSTDTLSASSALPSSLVVSERRIDALGVQFSTSSDVDVEAFLGPEVARTFVSGAVTLNAGVQARVQTTRSTANSGLYISLQYRTKISGAWGAWTAFSSKATDLFFYSGAAGATSINATGILSAEDAISLGSTVTDYQLRLVMRVQVAGSTPLATLLVASTIVSWESAPSPGASSGVPGGASGDSQYFDGVGFAGASYLKIHDGHPVITAGTPTTPASGRLKQFIKDVAGRMLFAVIGPSGLDVTMQPHVARNKVGFWAPQGNSTTAPLAAGIAAPTATGTATARNVATTNMVTSSRRLGYVSSATAGSLAGARAGVAQFWRGNAAGLGGFFFMARFATSDAATVSGARMFAGLSASTGAPTNVEPNTVANSIGVAQISTSNNLQIITRDATTAQTIDLGANFPANTLSADLYEISLFAPPNGSTVGYRVERLNTGHVAEGTLSTNLPVNTTFLGPTIWRCNNATALAVGIDIVTMYVETDF